MNFKFLKNTNLASLLMVSLNSVPSILASNTNNIVNNSFNINEVATNGSSITKKISNRSNGYIFTQFGHNLSINHYTMNPKGSIYADLAYRQLFNNNYYTNFGGGIKIGLLAKEKYRSSIENTNINVDAFIGIKHKIGIEAYAQLDYTLKKDIFSLDGNANQGVIFNIKYNNRNNYRFKWGSISLETGYSNLYTLANKGQSLFGIIRFNTKGIISYLGIIGEQINNYFNLQILIGSIQKEVFRSDIELKLGIMEKDKSITEGYYELESINKNNTIEYGISYDNLESEASEVVRELQQDQQLDHKQSQQDQQQDIAGPINISTEDGQTDTTESECKVQEPKGEVERNKPFVNTWLQKIGKTASYQQKKSLIQKDLHQIIEAADYEQLEQFMGIFIEVLRSEYRDYYNFKKFPLINDFKEVLETSESGRKTQLINLFIKTLKVKKDNEQLNLFLLKDLIEVFQVSEVEEKKQLLNIFKKVLEEEKDNKRKVWLIYCFPKIIKATEGEQRKELLNLFMKTWEEEKDNEQIYTELRLALIEVFQVSEVEEKKQLLNIFKKALEEEKDNKRKVWLIYYFPKIIKATEGEQRKELLNLFMKTWEEEKDNEQMYIELQLTLIEVFQVSEVEEKKQLLNLFMKTWEEEKDNNRKFWLINYFPKITKVTEGEQRKELLNLFMKTWEEEKDNIRKLWLIYCLPEIIEATEGEQRKELINLFKKIWGEEKDNVQMYNDLLWDFCRVFEVIKVDEVKQLEDIWLEAWERTKGERNYRIRFRLALRAKLLFAEAKDEQYNKSIYETIEKWENEKKGNYDNRIL